MYDSDISNAGRDCKGSESRTEDSAELEVFRSEEIASPQGHQKWFKRTPEVRPERTGEVDGRGTIRDNLPLFFYISILFTIKEDDASERRWWQGCWYTEDELLSKTIRVRFPALPNQKKDPNRWIQAEVNRLGNTIDSVSIPQFGRGAEYAELQNRTSHSLRSGKRSHKGLSVFSERIQRLDSKRDDL